MSGTVVLNKNSLSPLVRIMSLSEDSDVTVALAVNVG